MARSYVFECRECEAPEEFDIEPFHPGKFYGPPENCYPDEGGFAEGPEKCKRCGEAFDLEQVYQQWQEDNEPDEPMEKEDF